MTINSPAAVIFAMYVAAGRAGRRRPRPARRHAAERHPEGVPGAEGVRVPAAAVDAAGARHDRASLRPRCRAGTPISISGYHIREAGSTAAEELAFTLANGFAYVELALQAGLRRRRVRAPPQRSSSTPTSTSSRRSPSTAPPAASGPAGCGSATAPSSERSLQLRFHTQTAGVSLTAQQPEVNIVRTAIEALAGVLGGTQSLHTNSMDEALALPTEKAARIALRTQQVIAYETSVAHVADPLGGSWFVEALTDEMERQAEEIFAHLDELGDGSMLEGVHPRRSRRTGSRARSPTPPTSSSASSTPAGASWSASTGFTEGNDDDAIDLLADHQRGRGPPAQAARRRSRHDRDAGGRRRGRSPACAAEAADPEVNLMPALIDAVEHLRHRSARSWTRWPTSSAATSRCPRSDPAPAGPSTSPVESVADGWDGVRSTRASPPARSRPDRGK